MHAGPRSTPLTKHATPTDMQPLVLPYGNALHSMARSFYVRSRGGDARRNLSPRLASVSVRETTCSDHSAGKEHVSDGSVCFLSVAIPGRNPAAPWARLISCNRSSPFNGLRAISMSCLEIASNAWDRMSPVNTIAGVFEARAARNASNSWGQRDSNRTVSGEVVCLDL